MLTGRILVQFLAQIAAVHYLRTRRRDLARPYRIWLYPLPSAIAFVGWSFNFLSSDWPFIAFATGTVGAHDGARLGRSSLHPQNPASPTDAGMG